MPDQTSGQAQITNSGLGGGTGATLASFAAVRSVELLPASAAIHDGSGSRRRVRVPLCGQAISPGCVSFVCRFRVLSDPESEEVSASSQRHQFSSSMGVCRIRIPLDLFPAGTGERGGQSDDTTSPYTGLVPFGKRVHPQQRFITGILW